MQPAPETRTPVAQFTPEGPPRWTPAWYLQRHPSTWWWFLVPVITLGFTTFAIVGFAAVQLRRLGSFRGFAVNLVLAFAYLAVDVAYFTATSVLAPGGTPYEFLVGLSILVGWVIGTAHVALLQYCVQRAETSSDPAIAAARWRVQRRQEARRIAESNPAMALELRIGRPEIPGREYVDAGLIDLNHVPAEWLCSELEMTRAQADEIVAVRTERRGFTAVDEIVLYCSLITHARFEAIRDRLIVLPW